MSSKSNGGSKKPSPSFAPLSTANMSVEEMIDLRSSFQTQLQELTGCIPDEASSLGLNVYSNKITSSSEGSGRDSPHPLKAGKDLHWDYVMKEMKWLAKDFNEERTRHIANGKKISKAVEQWHKTKEIRKVKAAAAEVKDRRKLASKISREVSKFWMKINKVVTFKQKCETDEIRQKEMDKHLVYLVKQTERYTHMVADNLQGNNLETDLVKRKSSIKIKDGRRSNELDSVRKQVQFSSSDKVGAEVDDDGEMDTPLDNRKNRLSAVVNTTTDSSIDMGEMSDMTLTDDEDEEEFVGEEELDDETTMIEEEAHGAGISAQEEISMLKNEAEMSIDQLRAIYANMPDQFSDDDDGEEEDQDDNGGEFDGSKTPATDTSMDLIDRYTGDVGETPMKGDGHDESDDSFVGDDEQDDETTMIEEEARGGAGISAEEEISMLKNEAEMSIDQLRAIYANMPNQFSDDEEESDPEKQEDEDVTAADTSMDLVDRTGDVDETPTMDDDHDESDDSFVGDDEQDDETTMIEEETRGGAALSTEEEISMLKNEAEMPIDQLRAMYANMPNQFSDDDDGEEEEENGDDGIVDANGVGHGALLATDQQGVNEDDMHDDSDDSFVAAEELDDETTMIEEEARGAGMSAEEEISMLKNEAEMSVDQLRAMYANIPDSDDEEDEEEEDEEEEEEEEDDDDTTQMSVETPKSQNSTSRAAEEGKVSEGSTTVESSSNALARLGDADEFARSLSVERPFTLAKTLKLRKYQQIGLNWLVSLHERRLNGILADEMGLGKTIQTIAMLAYLQCYKGIWGPHLIVVPTSCIVNWETEFKKFCPAFKVLTYYGGAKTRKQLRSGWSRLNSFHVCITSYQLVVQDSSAFRRKRWYYMILDEAHNIKNFKSQRWQTLLNYNTQRRLLLTGTPLQNNLMELWSLMHFLMPHIFRSRSEFSYWFSNPLNNMVSGNRGVNNDLISRLHGIMRPFLLRRLKKDVAKQLPGKYEHVLMCKLSKRQMFLYEEFMARSTVKSALSGGHFMGMMNCLMQLRKVCNHPDLFEVRAIESPFKAPEVVYRTASIVTKALERSPLAVLSPYMHLNLWSIGDDSYSRSRVKQLQPDYTSFVTVDDVNMSAASYRSSSSNAYASQFGQQLRDLMLQQQAHRLEYNYNVSNFRCSVNRIPFDMSIVDALTFTILPLHLDVTKRSSPRAFMQVTPAWKELVKDVQSVANDLLDVIKTYTFILPKATSAGPQLVAANPSVDVSGKSTARKILCQEMMPLYEKAMIPFYPSKIRQSIFFPDRKLVQFDSGKLQQLAILLGKLKAGNHKCLIFTQMSKMLDILEVFLNIHSYTYVRLDGSTGVDKRQRLMDRFNNDSKLFCFILSTRSGGLGINLTGADTVIFYDSDWNPAMDAQAQDRAHRIGQTRDVHIYRLVTQSTVEENILVKARQKRHLDFLVMTEGNFDQDSLFNTSGLKDLLTNGDEKGDEATASNNQNNSSSSGSSSKNNNSMDVDEASVASIGSKGSKGGKGKKSLKEIEKAMAAAEDEEDISALASARQEASKEQAEFDENAPPAGDEAASDAGDDNSVNTATDKSAKAKQAKTNSSSSVVNKATSAAEDEKNLEAEFASWQAKVGPDFDSLKSALKPIERYALDFRTEIEPFYSMWFMTEQQKMAGMAADREDPNQQMWDVEQIEKEKDEEERRALEEGEMLAAPLTKRDVSRFQKWYTRQRKQQQQDRRRRILTGAGWAQYLDDRTNRIFWYNIDTGDVKWSTPKIIEEREALLRAQQHGLASAPAKAIQCILSFLETYPDRSHASEVCKNWYKVSLKKAFHKRVLSGETGMGTDRAGVLAKYGKNVFCCISDAIAAASYGDTIMLDTGHHWDQDLLVDKPLRIYGETDDPARCIIELKGSLVTPSSALHLSLTGLTIRRSHQTKYPASILMIKDRVKLSMYEVVLNNEGSQGGSAIYSMAGCKLNIYGSMITGGAKAGISSIGSTILVAFSKINKNPGYGIHILEGSGYVEDSYISNNGKSAVCLMGTSMMKIKHSDLRDNDSSLPFDVDTNSLLSSTMCVGDKESEKVLRMFAAKVGFAMGLARTRKATTKAMENSQTSLSGDVLSSNGTSSTVGSVVQASTSITATTSNGGSSATLPPVLQGIGGINEQGNVVQRSPMKRPRSEVDVSIDTLEANRKQQNLKDSLPVASASFLGATGSSPRSPATTLALGLSPTKAGNSPKSPRNTGTSPRSPKR